MSYTEVKVTGLCDAKCGEKAILWYGRTSQAYCGDEKCYEILAAAYIEHCKEFDARQKYLAELAEY